MYKMISTFYLMIMLFFSFPQSLFAHKVNIFFWIQGNMLYTESKFDSGKAIKNGKISVFDSLDQLVLSGNTDKNGCFSFKITQFNDLKIILRTPCGHKTSLLICKTEFEDFNSRLATTDSHPSDNVNLQLEKKYPSLKEIELIISKELNKNIQPLLKAIARGQQKKINLQDILGGLGYIMGLIGLGLYFKKTKI